MSENSGEWLTAQQLSDELQIAVGTLYNWRRRGAGPQATRIGAALRYRRSDLERWIAEQVDEIREPA